MLFDDVLRASEPLERVRAEDVRAHRPLLVPDALHDELEVRRLNARAVVRGLDGAEPAQRGLDLARTDLVEDAPDEPGLDRHCDAGELGVALDRAHDRGPRGLAVESIESKRVREEAGNATREAVELGERVLAQRDEDVDPERRGEERRKRLRKRPRASVVCVVEEILLRLVEHEVHVTSQLRLFERRASRAVGRSAPGLGDGLGECDARVLAPARKHDDERFLGELAQRARDGCPKQRRLPDAARPVENSQARRDEVRDDDLPFTLAPEEKERVEIRVVERVQPLVGRLGLAVPVHAASSRRSSSSTYACGSTSRAATSKRRQNACASGLGERCTAHER